MTKKTKQASSSAQPKEVPKGFEHRKSVQVYILPTKTATSKWNDDIQTPPKGVKQPCYWLGEYHAQSPSEMWIFPKGQEPKDLREHNLHGTYGYNHGKHETLWFLPPGALAPSSFTPQGTWTFPVEKRDISSIEPEQAGFLKLGDRHKGRERLDVSGTWRLLYKRDGERQPLQIYVRTPKGKLIDLIVEPDDTIDKVKDMVKDREGSPKDEIRLNFQKKPLRDPNATLDDCGIQDQDVLDMEPMEVRVKDVDGKIHTFVVEPTDRIGSLKKQIEKKEGTPVPHQRLFFGSKHLNDNQPTLRDTGIKHRDTLQLEPMQVHVKTPDGDKTVTLNVRPTDTIQNIKKQVEQKENIPVPDQRMEFKGKKLDDPRTTLDDNGIRHGDTLNLTPMIVYVMTPDKKKLLTLVVKPTDTIQDVKGQVEHKEAIPIRHQRLEYNGRKLDDPRSTLRDNAIRHGDTLNLTPMKIHVRLPDGTKTITLQVKPEDTIGNVKEMIDDEENMAPADQRLFFTGKPLTDDRATLDDCGIQHEDTLDLKEKERPPPPPVSPKPVVVAKPAPVTPKKGPEFTIGLSPWTDPFSSPTGYTPKKKKSRDGTRATGAGRLKNRYHTDFNSELHEIAVMAEQRHHLKVQDKKEIEQQRHAAAVQ